MMKWGWWLCILSLVSHATGATLWYNTSQAVSSDDTGVWQQKVTLAWNVSDSSKTYRIDWTYGIRGEYASDYAHIRVSMDSTETLSDTWWQNLPDAAAATAGGWDEVTAFTIRTQFPIGTHLIEMHYAAADATQVVFIKSATLVVYEVNVE
jgi:hypothetical protein